LYNLDVNTAIPELCAQLTDQTYVPGSLFGLDRAVGFA
jgi:hypothetical protein